MVVTHNEIINAIVLAENVAYLNAQARAIALANGETPCAEDNAKAIEIEQWITILQRAEAQVENGCITSDDVWQLIQSINEQYRDVDCDVSRTFSRNSSSGGGVNPPSGYVERVLGVNVDNSNPSRPVVRIYVDGVTITGNGTEADPFVAVGGGGGTVVSVNGQTGVVTLTTTDIAEGTRLYFTTARVLATALSGLSITGGAITSSDTVLQAFGKLQSQLNLLVGGVTYQGTWNASTNSPLLTSSVGTKGYYYVVSVAGTTSLNGINDWQVGDWAIFNGSIWQKVDNTNSQTLAQTLTAGNTSGANDIEFDATQGLLFANNSRLREGTIDAGLGGTKGIAQICAVGYELKWEAGRLYVMDGNGLFIRQSLYNFTTTPTPTDDTTKGYMVGSLWTLDDGTIYICSDATPTAAVWAIGGIPTLQQVTDAGATTTVGFTVDNGTESVVIKHDKIKIVNALGADAVITSPTLATTTNFNIPNKAGGTETFAMLSDITGGGGDVVGPASAVDNNIATFDGTTGKLIQDGGTTIADINTNAVDRITVKLAESITKGQAVYISGANGTNILVSKADNTTEATSSKTLGLLETTGATNAIVNVVTNGLLDGLDTSAATAVGDAVWLGTSGNLIFGLASKPYAPAHLVYIGVVSRKSATVGEIIVNIQNGFELKEIHDVSAQTPANKNGLFYNTSTSLWEARAVAATDIDANVSNTEFGYLDGVTSSIQTQLNNKVTVFASATDGTASSGITSTISISVLIPANTFVVDDVIRINHRVRATGTAGIRETRVYANTTSSLTGAILISTSTFAATILAGNNQRYLAIKNATTNTEVVNATTSLLSDYNNIPSPASVSTLAINWTVDQYIIFQVNAANAADSIRATMYSIEKL